MKSDTRIFKLTRVYEMAALVDDCVDNIGSFIELDWDAGDIKRCLTKSCKLSLLHHYIYAMIAVEGRRTYRKNPDILWDAIENDSPEDSMAAPIYALFHTYEVKYSPFLEYIEGITENDQTNLILDWFLSQESSFEELWEKIADEVFHILYSNRSFLLKFNNNLSHYLAKNPVLIPREARTKMGKIRRTHLPKWVKRAVFYRDQGRCVFCDKDLSGLLSVQEGVHFDHIVPLNLLGTNDPSNFQLLCEQCNLQKSGRSSSTSYRYKSWWDY